MTSCNISQPRPEAGTAVQPPHRDLNLTVVLQRGGIYLKSRQGGECPEIVPSSGLCWLYEQGLDVSMGALQDRLWYLFSKKYAPHGPRASRAAARRAITLLPEADLPWAIVVAALDAVREVPERARPSVPKGPARHAGCGFVLDRRAGWWRYGTTNGRSVRDTSCMYDHPFLGMPM